MGWMIGAIVVLCVTNAVAIWKWHQTRQLNRGLDTSLAAYRWQCDLYDRHDDMLRRKVYWARGGEWRKNHDFGQDTTLMAIELIEDLHGKVTGPQGLAENEPVAEDAHNDPDYLDSLEADREAKAS